MTTSAVLSTYIVTGTTRGIGRALSEEILARGHRLFTLSRAPEKKQKNHQNFTCDLRFPEQVQQSMTRVLNGIDPERSREVVLINNAGVLSPVGFLEGLTHEQIADHMQVNLLTPMILTSLFLRGTAVWPCPRRIILITSGAARRPYAGWSLYCTSKAGLEMLMRCAALEQQKRADGVAICAIAPGVVDTEMQKFIREVDENDFPARTRFTELHASNQIESPQKVAALLLDLDAGGQLAAGGLYDIRNVEWRKGQPTLRGN